MSLSSVKFWEELESLNNIDTGRSSYSNACPNAALRPFKHWSYMAMKNLNFFLSLDFWTSYAENIYKVGYVCSYND